ncbi:MAG: hypothetical protein HQM10_03875 [Candidatus Riflebacteria bacterium]|nr:hypothetical protein [Candidatus Riflebacteria bacterium]
MKFKNIVLALIMVILPMVAFSASYDLASQLDIDSVIAPGAYTTDQTSDAISGGNYRAHLFGIYVSAGSYTSSLGMNFNLTHCTTSTGSYTEVVSSDMIGVTPNASGTIYSVSEDITTASYHEFLYVGGMPYLKMTMDIIGDHSNATPTVCIIDTKGAKIIQQ